MRPLPLLCVLLLAALPTRAPAEAPETDEGPEAQEPVAAPEPIPCVAPAALKGDAAAAYGPACSFFKAVAEREPAALAPVVRAPFFFEGKAVASREEALKRWSALLADLRGTRSTLYGVELYTAEEMIKKYGKPPSKLEAVPLRGAMIAVGNLDGRAAVVALRKDGGSWTVFAFHD